ARERGNEERDSRVRAARRHGGRRSRVRPGSRVRRSPRSAGPRPSAPQAGGQALRGTPHARRGLAVAARTLVRIVVDGLQPEALEGAGLVTGAVNLICYRGPARHDPVVPWLTRPAYGPTRFFYFNLFESDVTGAPLAVRTRARGSVDEYARAVGRWLVTRDGF